MAKIFVVDDELGSRSVISEILADEGHEVLAAEDAAQARALYERIQPDLVVLDIWMPDVDGITLLKEWSVGGRRALSCSLDDSKWPAVRVRGRGG